MQRTIILLNNFSKLIYVILNQINCLIQNTIVYIIIIKSVSEPKLFADCNLKCTRPQLEHHGETS